MFVIVIVIVIVIVLVIVIVIELFDVMRRALLLAPPRHEI